MTRLKDAIDHISNAIISQKDYLTHLDREIGDGDHGINMARGFEAVLEKMDRLADTSKPGPVLKAVGSTLMNTIGGAAGPLYATGFLRAADVCDEDTAFNMYIALALSLFFTYISKHDGAPARTQLHC